MSTSKAISTYDLKRILQRIPSGGASVTTLTVTLRALNWVSNQQSVTATGVTSNNHILVSPAPSSYAAYDTSGVYCSAQAANSLTFNCTTTPDSDIYVQIMIFS